MTKRQPSGTPVGGQFAEERKPEGGDLVEPKKGKQIHLVAVYNTATKTWSLDPEMLSRDHVVYDLDRDDGEWESFEGNEDLNGEAAASLIKLLNPKEPSLSQTLNALVKEQALEFFDDDYMGDEGEYEASKAAFSSFIDKQLAERKNETAEMVWDSLAIDAGELQRKFEFESGDDDVAKRSPQIRSNVSRSEFSSARDRFESAWDQIGTNDSTRDLEDAVETFRATDDRSELASAIKQLQDVWSHTGWDGGDPDAAEFDSCVEQLGGFLEDEITDKATCILTGAEGENADDCITHEHEERS